jgi:hypothetical protein
VKLHLSSVNIALRPLAIRAILRSKKHGTFRRRTVRHDENRSDANVEGIRDMQSCCAMATLLTRFLLALVVGVIYLAVVFLQ